MDILTLLRTILAFILLLVVQACNPIANTESPSTLTEASDPVVATPIVPQVELASGASSPFVFGYTYQSLDGNRYVKGSGSIQPDNYIDIELDETPVWLVSAPSNSGSIWLAASANGELAGFMVSSDGTYENIEVNPASIQAGKPPILLSQIDSETPFVSAQLGSPEQSDISHGIPIPNSNAIADIDANGGLRLNSQWVEIPNSSALPDARILSDESGRLLFLSSPTTTYDHGVLGDAVEAISFSIVNIDGETASAETHPIRNGQVIEGIAPIWVDWNQDGEREIIVTLSDLANGAQVVVFNEQGQRIAEGPAIGQGYRWRHQIAVAPFGPNSEMELVSVLTPHLGGVVEFYQWQGNQLEIMATVPGYTSHVIGSRNLDMGAAADFDEDGIVEVLLPSQDRTHLGAIQRVEGGAIVDWQLPLDSVLSTNLSVVQLADGGLLLGAGLQDGRIRIWLP